MRLLKPLTRVTGHGVRPMDNIVIDDERPQEDEFALLLRGAPSPYEALVYPRASEHWERLTTDGYSADERARRTRVVQTAGSYASSLDPRISGWMRSDGTP